MIPTHENFILLAVLSINYLEGLNISALCRFSEEFGKSFYSAVLKRLTMSQYTINNSIKRENEGWVEKRANIIIY